MQSFRLLKLLDSLGATDEIFFSHFLFFLLTRLRHTCSSCYVFVTSALSATRLAATHDRLDRPGRLLVYEEDE